MIVTCHNCTTRLQLDDSKVPARPFGVRCPKCQEIINAQPAQRDALAAVGDVPASGRVRREPDAAPVAQVAPPEPPKTEPVAATVVSATAAHAATASANGNGNGNGSGNGHAQGGATPEGDLLRLLGSLLRRAAAEGEAEPPPAPGRRPGWKRRRALVCTGPSYGGEVSRVLGGDGYEVLIASDAAQAAERLREDEVDVLVLDPEFDMGRQGAAQVGRELASMRMPERRRLVFVQLAPNERTADAHAAFLAGANLVVNPREVRTLPRALEKNIHDLNELYRDFNRALGLAEL